MAIAPTTAQIFDLSKVAYLNGKSSEKISAAAAVEQPSHAEMVTVVTGFIDKLIQSGVDKLETAASSGSDTKAQQKAQGNLDQYNQDKDSAVTPFVTEVAGDLAKHLFTVKELLVADNLASKREDGSTIVAKAGTQKLNSSTNALVNQTLELVQAKLSDYGVKFNSKDTSTLQKEIIKELKSPPKQKSETPAAETPPITEGAGNTTVSTETKETQTPNETAANPKELLAQFTKFITEISNLASVRTLLKQDHGLETLSKLNKDLADLNPIIKDKNALPAALENAFKALNDEAHSENKTFINNYVANPEKFTEEFSKLDDNQKLQIQMTLINIEGQAKQTKTINNIASSITEIKKGLGGDRLSTLLNELNSVNESLTSSSQENHLESIDNLLNEFNQNLKTANQAGSGKEKIDKRNKVIEAFIEKLNTGLKNGSISNADIELIQDHLDPNKTENQEQSQKSITEKVFKNSIKNLNISEEQLKSFGGLAIAAVVGLMVFCPNAIGNLVQSGTGLAAMAAQTLPMLFQAKAMMQMSQNRGNGHREIANTQAA